MPALFFLGSILVLIFRLIFQKCLKEEKKGVKMCINVLMIIVLSSFFCIFLASIYWKDFMVDPDRYRRIIRFCLVYFVVWKIAIFVCIITNLSAKAQQNIRM